MLVAHLREDRALVQRQPGGQARKAGQGGGSGVPPGADVLTGEAGLSWAELPDKVVGSFPCGAFSQRAVGTSSCLGGKIWRFQKSHRRQEEELSREEVTHLVSRLRQLLLGSQGRQVPVENETKQRTEQNSHSQRTILKGIHLLVSVK